MRFCGQNPLKYMVTKRWLNFSNEEMRNPNNRLLFEISHSIVYNNKTIYNKL